MFKTLGILAGIGYLILSSQMGGFLPGFSILFLTVLVMAFGTVAVMGLSAPTDITRGALKTILAPMPLSLEALSEELGDIAIITRRDGLLALESKRKELKDPLLRLLL